MSPPVPDASQKPVAGAQPARPREGRLAFIHGLRGIAALAVALFHCYDSTPVGERVVKTMPYMADQVIRRGFLGVDLFFVISGFVISLTLYGRLSTLSEFGRFFVRRQVRLDPPYWTAIALSIGSALVVNHLNPLTAAPVPSPAAVLAHMFYLQDFLHFKDIVGVFWTLCMEVQFYLFFGAVLLLFQRASISGRAIAWAMLPLYALSIGCFWNLLPSPQGLFLPRWFEFFTGVMLFLFWRQEISRKELAVYLGVLLLAIIIDAPTDNGMAKLTTATVLCIAVLFVVAGITGGISTWLDRPVLRYFGSISYSLYLMHAVVGIRLLKLIVRPTISVPVCWTLYAFGLLLSVAAADLIYRFIERPSMEFSHRLRWRSA